MPDASSPVLEVEGLRVAFGAVTALDDVSLAVPHGATVGLIGPNGAGKTTLLNAISGFVRASGSIRCAGRELLGLAPSRRGRLGVARTFQQPRVFAGQTVAENVAVARDHAAGVPLAVGEALALVGLACSPRRPCAVLSPHEQRLVGIARAIVARPALLLLDEPGAGLVAAEVEQLHGVLARVRERLGVAMLLIDHNMDVVLRASERVHVLDFGQLIFSGTPEEVRASQLVADAYLGHEWEAA